MQTLPQTWREGARWQPYVIWGPFRCGDRSVLRDPRPACAHSGEIWALSHEPHTLRSSTCSQSTWVPWVQLSSQGRCRVLPGLSRTKASRPPPPMAVSTSQTSRPAPGRERPLFPYLQTQVDDASPLWERSRCRTDRPCLQMEKRISRETETLTVRERGAVYVQNGGTAEGALCAGSDPRAVSPPPAAGLGAPHPVRCDGTCAASQKLMFFLWQKALLFPISKWEILRSMFLDP